MDALCSKVGVTGKRERERDGSTCSYIRIRNLEMGKYMKEKFLI
jgi:hypothetical protein